MRSVRRTKVSVFVATCLGDVVLRDKWMQFLRAGHAVVEAAAKRELLHTTHGASTAAVQALRDAETSLRVACKARRVPVLVPNLTLSSLLAYALRASRAGSVQP